MFSGASPFIKKAATIWFNDIYVLNAAGNHKKYIDLCKLATVQRCWLSRAVSKFINIPLSHYSRNAPRIHNVGHIFQIAKVPSGVCKIRPAFLLDSATFLAIANDCQCPWKCSGRQLRVGEIFHFFQNS